MLRKLSVALATAVTVAIGLMGGLAAPATAATNNDVDVELKSVCKPDDEHALLAVINHSDSWVKYVIKKKDGDENDAVMDQADLTSNSHDKVWGEVGPGQKAFEKVPWESPEDTWLLFAWETQGSSTDANDLLNGLLSKGVTDSHYRPVDEVKVGDLKRCFTLEALCKPDADHVKLQITNNTWRDHEFLLVRKEDHEKHTGTVEKHSSVIEKVSWESPEDTWLLFVRDVADTNESTATASDAEVMTDGGHKFHFAAKLKVGDVKRCFTLTAVCKPDANHVKLLVSNNSPWDVKFLLVRKHDDEKVTGEVDAKSTVEEIVPFDSPQDTWLLFVKKEHEDDGDADAGSTDQVMWNGQHKFKFADKLVVGNVALCQQPSGTPTLAPTSAGPLPVTGTSTIGIMGAGLGLLGVGALLLLFARRRRATE